MSIEIIKIPNSSLHKPSRMLSKKEINSHEIQTLIDRMIPTMYESHGIGLAAPQVAHNIQLCIIGKDAIPNNFNLTREDEDLILINPTIIRTGKKARFDTEGCLSVPEKNGRVRRICYFHIDALDRHGKPISFDVAHKNSHDFGHVLQHEIDHLNGILYIDKAESVWKTE